MNDGCDEQIFGASVAAAASEMAPLLQGPPAGATAPPCGRARAPRLRSEKIIVARAETRHHPAGDKHQLVTFIVEMGCVFIIYKIQTHL